MSFDGQCAKSFMCLLGVFVQLVSITLAIYAPAIAAASAADSALAEAGVQSSSGRVVAVWEAGVLSEDIALTFAGGAYEPIILGQDTVLYRAGVAGNPLGRFFSKEPSLGVIQTRIDKAVPLRWPGGNPAPLDTGYEILIPGGTTVYSGVVADQGGIFVGGTGQIFVPTPWDIPGVRVVASWPLG